MEVLRVARRYFLPSRTFGHYMAHVFLVRFLGLLIGVVAILQMLDLLDKTDEILAAEGATTAALWRYVSLRLPQLLSQFAPFSALLAILAALAQLNQHSEIVVMKASGLSPHRILLPLGLVCATIAALHFLFDQLVVAPATDALDYWRRFDFATDLPPPPDVFDDLWLVEDRALVLVEAASRTGSRVVLDRVTVYERDAAGLLSAITRADFAWYMEGRWTLFEVRRFDVATHEVQVAESLPWQLAAPPERFLSLGIDAAQMPYWRLAGAIERLEAEGQLVSGLRTALYQKIAGPAATLLMPLLGAVAGFGVARRGRLFARVAAGMALGFTFFVADNFMVAMGQLGSAPPLAAAFGPFAIFLMLGFAVLFFTEE